MPNSNAVQERIKGFLKGPMGGRDLAANEDIFATGAISSLFAMQLVMFLEKEFGIAIENDDLELDNFRSIDRMAAFVEMKRA